MQIIECKTDMEINSTFPIMVQLRPKINQVEYLPLIRSLEKSEGYQLFGAFEGGLCIAAAGIRIKRCLFSEGRPEIYIDDLVTDQIRRSQGIGHSMFEFLKKKCRELNCFALVLDSGTQRLEAHRFYEREGMKNTALHFFRPLSPLLPESF